eukprot:g34159.t1
MDKAVQTLKIATTRRCDPFQIDCKTKELIVDFRKKRGEHAPIYINGTELERMNSTKFIRVTITNDLSWTSHVNATVKKAQQHLFFHRGGSG